MERCTKRDDGGSGCVRTAGHTGRCKVRDDCRAVFKAAGAQPSDAGEKLAEHVGRKIRDDRVAALCELATAMGLVRLSGADGAVSGWVNPAGGRVVAIEPERMTLQKAKYAAQGDVVEADGATLMTMLGVKSLAVTEGTLYSAGGRMIIQTPSGALRPAELRMAEAPGPAGVDGID